LVESLPEEAYNKVIEQYESLYDRLDQRDELDKAQLVKDKLGALQMESQNPELTGLMEAIDNKLSTSEKDKAQLNLQLAKISVFLTDTQKADAYIEKAVENLDKVQNEVVVQGLGALASLEIKETGSFDELKDLPDKVKTLSNDILPVKLPSDAKVQNAAFEDHVAGYFTRKAVEVNITKIDTSAYPDIKAYVQFGFDTGEDFSSEVKKRDLKLEDTGSALTDYKLDKIKIDRSNIILCVDVSPSMQNFMNDLKAACLKFTATMGKTEKVGIIGFDSGVIYDYGFESQKTTLDANINSLSTGNGTNIHNAVLQSLSKFTPAEGQNNIVIVLSDGANNDTVSAEQMAFVGEQCLKTGATLYTIGLGESVDGNYLSELARQGGGKFIYAPSSNQLEAFYGFLHNQIRNQYKLSYQAPQQEVFDRYLQVALPKQQAKGSKNYSLISSKELTTEEQAALIEQMEKAGGLYAKGLDRRCIIKGANQEEEVSLIGGGFSGLKSSEVEINLEGYGPLKSNRVSITDNEHIKLVLPSNIPVGNYTLKVKLRDRTYSFTDELQVLKSGSVKTIAFGPYKISANEIKNQGGNKYLLRGNVQINDFLRFKGDLTLEGDYKNEHYIGLKPQSESYIAFRKGSTPNYLVDEVFLKYNLNLNLKKWEKFSLSRDGSPVDINLANKVDMGLLEVPSPKITFNPDNVEFMTNKINLNLPMQKYLFLAAGAKPISFEGESKMLITAEQIAYVGSFSLETDGSLLGKRLLNVLELKKLKGSADTMKGDFTFEAGVGLTFWRSEENELGLKLGWKKCLFDELNIRLPWEWKVLQLPKSPVPVTIKEITGGVSNLSLSATDGWDKLSKLKYMLQSDILVAKASDVMPFLDNIDWLKQKIPGILLVDDAKATVTFEKLAFTFDAKLKLFEEFDVGSVEFALGNYEFKNSLLNMGPQDAVGVHIKNTRGIDLNLDKLQLKLQNAIGIDVNNKGMFLQTTGVASASVSLWKFERKCSFDGDALIAVHPSSVGTQFTIGLRGRDLENGNATDFRFYVNGDKIAIVGIDIPFTEKDVIEIDL
ncbi:MAG: VWA domain-containing protein, partial [Clostridia bacterium]|nr:VWA domain-containing protein [Clostridia bacterium]